MLAYQKADMKFVKRGLFDTNYWTRPLAAQLIE